MIGLSVDECYRYQDDEDSIDLVNVYVCEYLYGHDPIDRHDPASERGMTINQARAFSRVGSNENLFIHPSPKASSRSDR